jgi:hypothetical protein
MTTSESKTSYCWTTTNWKNCCWETTNCSTTSCCWRTNCSMRMTKTNYCCSAAAESKTNCWRRKWNCCSTN